MSNMMILGEPYFFGAFKEAGHRLYDKRMRVVYDRRAGSIDGSLVNTYGTPYEVIRKPLDGTGIKTNLDGTGYVAYSFVDYTSDSRGGSNSNFFV